MESPAWQLMESIAQCMVVQSPMPNAAASLASQSFTWADADLLPESSRVGADFLYSLPPLVICPPVQTGGQTCLEDIKLVHTRGGTQLCSLWRWDLACVDEGWNTVHTASLDSDAVLWSFPNVSSDGQLPVQKSGKPLSPSGHSWQSTWRVSLQQSPELLIQSSHPHCAEWDITITIIWA